MGFSVRSICQVVVFYSSLFDVQLAWCLVCPPSIQCVASPHYHRLTMEICMENISGTCSHLPPSMPSFFPSFHVIPFPLCSNIQKFARGKETSVNRSQTSKCKRDEVKSWLHSMADCRIEVHFSTIASLYWKLYGWLLASSDLLKRLWNHLFS